MDPYGLERRHQKLAPLPVFLRRVAVSLLIAAALASVALCIGIAGYHWIADLPWIDALLNASMILGGMGPVDPLLSKNAKLFAAAYALFSGLIFIGVMGIVSAPLAHRMLHHFHIDENDLKNRRDKK
ncbi:MAG: hypothetical protein HY282_13300 [Nitrospirae bacterium]|nr:hypothetical protein [Candidatus Manganitrophaceae bacterium]